MKISKPKSLERKTNLRYTSVGKRGSLRLRCASPRVNFSPLSSFHCSLKSGRRGSNPPPSAWKADALPNELLPLMICFLIFDLLSPAPKDLSGERRIRTFEDISQQIYSLSQLATLVSPLLSFLQLRAEEGTSFVRFRLLRMNFSSQLKSRFQSLEPKKGLEPPTS